jgi:hypothetical protein
MYETLRFAALLGYYVEAEGPDDRGSGVVDSVISASPGVLITFADGCSTHVRDPAEWIIGVYRRAPDGC